MRITRKVESYLKEHFGPDTRLIGMKRLGEGMHGVAYLIKFRTGSEEKRLIMKTLSKRTWVADGHKGRW